MDNRIMYLQWRSCERWTPLAYQDVLVSLVRRDRKQKVKIAYIDANLKWHKIGEAWEVVAWMPLPDPLIK